ncbi:MAG: T9SS type A sorting domain-containing protein [Bacteroidales bacterium]|nr:T9SS type A sorting domain-containing protein [Bacteroidales bacterium]MCB8999945.1 T9SS type A sorting domain-containing protein [Bacteroidales bacterium]MCB9012604.1 T9SS type A sorting domain-containing protein [Bacteroidales bacterium]
MRSVLVFSVFLLLCHAIWAQFPAFDGSLIEYRPAPGQFINDNASGTPLAAEQMLEGKGNVLSLGAFGGLIVLKFNKSIENNADNPYGIDFVIYGNASAGHSEPGIVKVMKDENHNGLPDDTWYEIAGSEHFNQKTVENYSIRYENPKASGAADVSWSDNTGGSGKVFKNSFHSQSYYPGPDNFPAISNDYIDFSGTRLESRVRLVNGNYQSLPCTFGYADNHPLTNQNFTGLPDNPYTPDIIEGDGGDGIDISWARNADGEYADLDAIDFVMICTAVNDAAGWLGEISTEIRALIDVSPNNNIKGESKMILTDLPERLLLYDTIPLSARVFFSGRPVSSETLNWYSGNPDILEIHDGSLIARKPGIAEVTASLTDDPSVSKICSVSVVEPAAIILDKYSASLKAGDLVTVHFTILDESMESLSAGLPLLSIDDKEVAEIESLKSDRIILKALKEGSTSVNINCKNFPEVKADFKLEVVKEPQMVKLYFSLNDASGSILPSREYQVHKQNVLEFTERHSEDFSLSNHRMSLADAITSVLLEEGFSEGGNSFAFRQDEFGGKGLYLWQLGKNYEYLYGWGGYRLDKNHANTWFAILNDMVFASGFDTIEVSDNDHVSLVNITDNSIPWSFQRISAGRLDFTTEETIKLYADQLDIFPEKDKSYSVSGPFPLANADVSSDPGFDENDVYDFQTRFNGDFILSFSSAGPRRIKAGNSEALQLEIQNPLKEILEETGGMQIYPNPCNDKLYIECPDKGISGISLYSPDGRLRFVQSYKTEMNSLQLDTEKLEKGLYFLEVISEGRHSVQKIIRQ